MSNPKLFVSSNKGDDKWISICHVLNLALKVELMLFFGTLNWSRPKSLGYNLESSNKRLFYSRSSLASTRKVNQFS